MIVCLDYSFCFFFFSWSCRGIGECEYLCIINQKYFGYLATYLEFFNELKNVYTKQFVVFGNDKKERKRGKFNCKGLICLILFVYVCMLKRNMYEWMIVLDLLCLIKPRLNTLRNSVENKINNDWKRKINSFLKKYIENVWLWIIMNVMCMLGLCNYDEILYWYVVLVRYVDRLPWC